MLDATRKLAVVTGASTGIGLELARLCARYGYDLVIAKDNPATAHVTLAEQLAKIHTGMAEPGSAKR